jgi:hypothetical protein
MLNEHKLSKDNFIGDDDGDAARTSTNDASPTTPHTTTSTKTTLTTTTRTHNNAKHKNHNYHNNVNDNNNNNNNKDNNDMDDYLSNLLTRMSSRKFYIVVQRIIFEYGIIYKVSFS